MKGDELYLAHDVINWGNWQYAIQLIRIDSSWMRKSASLVAANSTKPLLNDSVWLTDSNSRFPL